MAAGKHIDKISVMQGASGEEMRNFALKLIKAKVA